MSKDPWSKLLTPEGEAAANLLVSGPPYPEEPLAIEPRSRGAVFVWRGLSDASVRGELKAGSAGLRLAELRVLAHDGHEVTTDVLRRVPLGRILQVVRARLAWMLDEDQALKVFGEGRRSAEELDLAEAAQSPKKRGGRPPLGPEHYRAVAVTLLDELTRGPARGVHRRLASRLTAEMGRVVTDDTARDWVRIARSQHWLAPTKQGRPGAEPGRALLAELPSAGRKGTDR